MIDPLVEHYQRAALASVGSIPVYRFNTENVVLAAANAAVTADRARMAEQLRNRVLLQPSMMADVDMTLAALLDEAFLDLAQQIENGLPYTELDQQS